MIQIKKWGSSAKIAEILLEDGQDTGEKIRQISRGLRMANEAVGIRCIVIRSQGGDFLTGDTEPAVRTAYQQAFDENRIPVILGIGGICSGVGRDLLEKGDLAVAADHAVLEGYETPYAAAAASAVNEAAEPGQMEQRLRWYIDRLVEIPEPLTVYGHKIYFAMEKLPDRQSRSRYGTSVQDEIMMIQASLNRKQREAAGEPDTCLRVWPDDADAGKNRYDREHSILFELQDDVEYIRLNAPRYQNRMDWRTSMELAGAYAVANSLPSLKAIVVTGVGKWFHLGGIRHNQEDIYEQKRFADQLRIRNQIMREIRVPLISAVNGECSGGGMSLVLKSDMVIAAESAVFGYPEVRHNGFACNAMVNTMGLIPKKAALKYFYFGDLFSAQEAKAYGIVHQVVPDCELERAVEEAVKNLPAKRKFI